MSQHVSVIIQARLKSTRLPGKTMLLLPTGRTVLHEVVWRCGLIEGVNSVVMAISEADDCDWLMAHARHAHCKHSLYIAIGPEQDVLARYAFAAEKVGADHIMRITSDCPCLNPIVCGRVLHKHLKDGNDYTSNVHPRTYPHGYDCEVFTRTALRDADILAADPREREHVTPWMVTSKTLSRKGNLTQKPNESTTRLTLDTIDDYVMICRELSNATNGCVHE